MTLMNNFAFERCVPICSRQFGLAGDPTVTALWREKKINDDPVIQSNKRGFLSFASAGPNTRTTQIFINFVDNENLDGMGFAPFARVVRGMDAVDRIYTGYGEGAPGGKGPRQGDVMAQGNALLKKSFSKLSYIKAAAIIQFAADA